MALLLRYWWVAALSVMLAFAGIQTARLRGAQADVRALRAEVAQFRAAYDALAGSVQRQNQAVNEWQTKAEQAAQAGRKAREQAAKVSMHHQASALALAAAVAAPAAGLTCRDAVGVVREDLLGRP